MNAASNVPASMEPVTRRCCFKAFFCRALIEYSLLQPIRRTLSGKERTEEDAEVLCCNAQHCVAEKIERTNIRRARFNQLQFDRHRTIRVDENRKQKMRSSGEKRACKKR